MHKLALSYQVHVTLQHEWLYFRFTVKAFRRSDLAGGGHFLPGLEPTLYGPNSSVRFLGLKVVNIIKIGTLPTRPYGATYQIKIILLYYCVKTLKHEFNLNVILKINSYLTQTTMLFHYKDQVMMFRGAVNIYCKSDVNQSNALCGQSVC